MLEKIKKLVRNEFKKSNFKSFFFFLILSTLIWVLVQFSKHYTEVLVVPVQYINYPKDKIINKKGSTLELRVKKSGFQIAWFKLFRPKIKIDLSTLPADSTFLEYSIRKYHKDLLRELPLDLNNAEFLDEAIHIPYLTKSVKKVPLVSKMNIQYAPGYASEQEVQLKPDSVKLSGPDSLLNTISKIYTKPTKREDVKKDLDGAVKLENPDSRLTLYQNKVSYHLGVEKFTERELTVPITVIHAPENIDISLYPPSVRITFKVSLKRYNQIQSIDFQIVCDYNDISTKQKFLFPRVTEKPKIIKSVNIFPKKIQYVIKK